MSPTARTPRRSWVDVIIGWVDRLPGPPWAFYAIVAVVISSASVLLRWADGTVPYPQVNPVTTIFAGAGVYCFAVVHCLNFSARRALSAFRSALGDLETSFDELEHDLTRTPVWISLVAIPLGLAVQAVGIFGSDDRWAISADASVATNAFTIVVILVLNVTFWVYVLRTLRQLALIVRIHRDATDLRLYDTGPHVAFARFTLATAISITIPYALVELLVILLGTITVFEASVFVFAILLSVAMFALPLQGIHRRLVDEKARMLSAADLRFGAVAEELHTKVDSGDVENVDGVKAVMESLVIESDRIRKVSTWPWSTGTIGGFVSSIGLPVIVFVITTLIARLLN